MFIPQSAVDESNAAHAAAASLESASLPELAAYLRDLEAKMLPTTKAEVPLRVLMIAVARLAERG